MFFELYPNTNFHELNLDWIIATIKKLDHDMDDFEAMNKITFDGAWDITKQYKPWTIVNDNGAGYISIKPVPAGILLTNADYWRGVVDYTATIADLQNRVVTLEGEMDDAQLDITNLQTAVSNHGARLDVLDHGNIVMIGDSYGDGVGSAGSWCDYAADFLGLTSDENYFKASMTTVGFCNTYLGNNFQTLMETLAGTMTTKQKNDTTKIIVGGGFNDQTYSVANIINAIGNFVTSAKTLFPNAKVYVACFGWSTVAEVRQLIIKNSLQGYSACAQAGASYIVNSQYLLHNYSLIQADTTHPTDAGAKYIGYGIGAFIASGSTACPIQREIVTITPASLWDGGIDNGIYVRQDNAITAIDIYNVELKLSSPGSLFANYDYPLGDWNSNLIKGGKGGEEFTAISTGIAEFVTTGGTYTTNFIIYLGGTNGDEANIRFGSIGTQTSTPNITKIVLRGYTGILPTLLC